MGNPSQAISDTRRGGAAKLQPTNISHVTAGRPFKRMGLATVKVFINRKESGVREGKWLREKMGRQTPCATSSWSCAWLFLAWTPFRLRMHVSCCWNHVLKKKKKNHVHRQHWLTLPLLAALFLLPFGRPLGLFGVGDPLGSWQSRQSKHKLAYHKTSSNIFHLNGWISFGHMIWGEGSLHTK